MANKTFIDSGFSNWTVDQRGQPRRQTLRQSQAAIPGIRVEAAKASGKAAQMSYWASRFLGQKPMTQPKTLRGQVQGRSMWSNLILSDLFHRVRTAAASSTQKQRQDRTA